MTKKIFLLAVLVVSLGANGHTQELLTSKDSAKLKKYEDKAIKGFDNFSFSMTADIYEKILDKNFVSPKLLKAVGDSYYFNANYKKASINYEKLINGFGNTPDIVGAEYYFRYAQALKSLEEYDKADSLMMEFANRASEDKRAAIYQEDNGPFDKMSVDSGKYSLDTVPKYYSVYSEFAPSFYKKKLIFSSDRDTGNLARYRSTWNGKDFLDLYEVEIDSSTNNEIGKVKFEDDFITRVHESTSVSTQDGKTLYFTVNNFKDGKFIKDEDNVVRLKIFRADLENGVWVIKKDLFDNEDYSVAHPALSPDEKTLYFASDMNNPFPDGESDIYCIGLNEDGSFNGKPVALKGQINTPSRETFPFVSSSGVLYFSSDGHPGLGGLDIFSTKIENDRPQSPITNLGSPINSSGDDFTFIIKDDTKLGYLASNRDWDSKEDDNIYSFKELECIQKISGIVRNKISNDKLAGATIKVIDESNIEIDSTLTDSTGYYELNINRLKGNFIRVLAEGYITTEVYFEEFSDCKPLVLDYYMEPEFIDPKCGDDLSVLIPDLRSTIYFKLDSAVIREDAKEKIEIVIALMEKYPSLKIKLKAHTDSQGPDAYNLALSERRAQATVDYMLTHSDKITTDRLEAQGYGETDLANKACPNNVRCSDKEHEKNRRTEFIICGE